MTIVRVVKDRYTTDSLYQYDYNQELVIHGLSLPSTPEIHFANSSLNEAIVKQGRMDNAGVVSVDIPNDILTYSNDIDVYICIYEGDAFKVLYKFTIKVNARKKPADYIASDEEKIYSYNALENKLNETIELSLLAYDEANEKLENAVNEVNETKASVEELKADAKTYADNSKTSADNAKTSETNAKTAEIKAKDYMERTKDYSGVIYREVLSSRGTVVEKTTINFTGSMYTFSGMGTDNIVEGGIYIVRWNSDTYLCTAYEDNGSVMLGNKALFGGEDTGEPFCIEMITENSAVITKSNSNTESVVFKVFGQNSIVYDPIDPRCVKGMYHEADPVVILPEITLTRTNTQYSFGITEPFELEPGETYTVIADGNKYKFVCKVFDLGGEDLPYLGNRIKIDGVDTGEPITLTQYHEDDSYGIFATLDGPLSEATSVTLSIICGDDTVSKVPSECIDAGWIGSYSDWIKVVDNKSITISGGLASINSILSIDEIKDHAEQIKVIYDGVEYICDIQITDDNIYVIGNTSYLDGFDTSNIKYMSNGEPFCIIAQYMTSLYGEDGVHTLLVYNKDPIPMPAKFMPDPLDYIVLHAVDADLGDHYFKLTVDSNGTLNVVEITE